MDAEEILSKAVDAALPRVTVTSMALCEQAMAKGLEAAAVMLRALADDIIAGRAPVSDIYDAATVLEKSAADKRHEARKVLDRN